MDEQKVNELADKWLKGTITPAELEALEAWYNSFPEHDAAGLNEREVGERLYGLISERAGLYAEERRPRRVWLSVAAAVLTMFGISIYFLAGQQTAKVQFAALNPEHKMPARKGIVLTVANGKPIDIDQHHQGKITTADGTHIDYESSLLTYAKPTVNEQPVLHTLTNNSGTKFNLKLADGTEVFLDAASSITYPNFFAGAERKVSVTGQAYFIVKHNEAQPFRVTIQNTEIEDVGTEFNVSDFEMDAALKTTLVEGAINLKFGPKELSLKPGQQAVLNESKFNVAPADVEAVTAWLQGKLVFHHETLESILKRVSRIYGVQFVWLNSELKTLTFGGSVSQTKRIATILNFFRKTGEVDFKMEGSVVKVFKQHN